RYLNDESVQAYPPSAAYRLRKIARRNRAAFVTVVFCATALLLGSTVSTWQAIRATRARNAEIAARVAESAAKRLAEARADRISRDLEQLTKANGLIESGRYHANFAHWAKAESEFGKAVVCRPDNSRVWTERAEFYLRLGLWDRAAADFDRAFRLQ